MTNPGPWCTDPQCPRLRGLAGGQRHPWHDIRSELNAAFQQAQLAPEFLAKERTRQPAQPYCGADKCVALGRVGMPLSVATAMVSFGDRRIPMCADCALGAANLALLLRLDVKVTTLVDSIAEELVARLTETLTEHSERPASDQARVIQEWLTGNYDIARRVIG